MQDMLKELANAAKAVGRRTSCPDSQKGLGGSIAALVHFVVSRQARLRNIDGWRKILAVLGQHPMVAA